MKTFLQLTLLATSVALTPYIATAQKAAAPAAPASCAPQGDLNFVCGVISAEDILPVDAGRWILAGSFNEKYKEGAAGLYLIDPKAKTFKPVVLSVAAKPDPNYNCTAPDVKTLQTHGLDVVPGQGGMTTVYAINHAGRESVEVFQMNAAKGSAEWVGCVVMPAGAIPNSVAALPKGGFVVTKFLDSNDKDGIKHVLEGQINGTTYRWTPGKGFSEVPGTHLSGDNGILVSKDGKWLYINAWGTREIYKVPLSGQGEPSHVKVDFSPDNLRWAPDGTIFATGQFVSATNLASRHGWATVRIDPSTMKATPLVKEQGYAEFDDATTAVQVGQTLWFGTFRGDRVAYRAIQ